MTTETMIVYRSCDRYDFKVSEEVVLESSLMKDLYLKDKKDNPEKKKHIYCFPTTKVNLAMVIDYCCNLIPHRDFLSIDVVTLFNLIQAAHFFMIQRLMDLSCKILVLKNRQISKYLLSNLVECSDSEDDSNLKIGILLRSRQKDTFINDSDFLDVYYSPFVLNRLNFVQRGTANLKDRLLEIVGLEQSPDHLLKPILSLEEFIRRDPRLAYYIRAGVVRYFIKLLNTTHFNEDHRLDIQRPILSILSRARYDVCGDVIEHELLPHLVGLVSDPKRRLAISAVIALTRIAYTFPDRIKVIVDGGALEAARTALDNHLKVYWSMEHLAKFLATVCRGYSSSFNDDLSSDKVGKILTILDIVCQKWSYQYRMVHTFTCYTLLYLSYDRCVAFEEEVWNRLRQRLVDYISIANDPGHACILGIPRMGVKDVNLDQMLVGSALGVVGHIMRWGNQDQMQSLTEVPRFWGCLQSMLCSKLKKFQMEACQIISNMVARRKTLIKDVLRDNAEDHICDLLLKGGSDVKMEAAWAMFNIICGQERLFSMIHVDVKLQEELEVRNMKYGSIRYDDIDTYDESIYHELFQQILKPN